MHGVTSSACLPVISRLFIGRIRSAFSLTSGLQRARRLRESSGSRGFRIRPCALPKAAWKTLEQSIMRFRCVMRWPTRACPIALFIGDLDAAERFVTMLIDHSEKHAFDTWLALGHICEAVLLIKRDDVVTGLPLLRAALDELRETGYFHRYLGSLGAFAEALGRAGQVE